MSEPVRVYFSLGSNLGNRQDNLDRALKQLSERMRMGKISSIYDTEAVGPLAQPRFLNLAAEAYTNLKPEGLLAMVKALEQKMGRYSRTGEPRVIDVDILLYGDQVVNTPALVIPHPEMAKRSFVMVPMAEIAPDVIHPVLQKSMQELSQAIKEVQGVMKLG